MKKLLSYHILTLTLIFFLSCNGSTTHSSEKNIENKNSIEEDSKISLDTLTDNRFAFIRELEILNSDLLVKVDYVDYLTGQEAVEAEWRDEAYFVDGDDTITNITDGFYISNVNQKLRAFLIQDKISVDQIIDDDGPQKIQESKPLNRSQIETYIKNETLLFLYVKKGIIERIDERFMP